MGGKREEAAERLAFDKEKFEEEKKVRQSEAATAASVATQKLELKKRELDLMVETKKADVARERGALAQVMLKEGKTTEEITAFLDMVMPLSR